MEILTKYDSLLKRILEVLKAEVSTKNVRYQILAVHNAIVSLKSFLTTFNESMSISHIKELSRDLSDDNFQYLQMILPVSGKLKVDGSCVRFL